MAVSTMEHAMRAVGDGDEVYFGGFGFAEPFAAAHQLIRDGVRELHLVRSSGGVLLDQLVGAGCVSDATIAHCWNAIGPVPTNAFRRAVEDGDPRTLDVEEHGLGSLVLRLFAGARRLPFIPAGPVESTGQFEHRAVPEKFSAVQFDGETHYVMRPLNPDVSIVHAQRADERGNVQLSGARADVKYGAMAAETLIVTTESIVQSDEIRQAPERTIVPGFMVDHVVETPGGAHPSGVHDCYGRDIDFLEHYGEVTRTRDGFDAFLEEFVYEIDDHANYLEAVRASGFEEAPA